LYAVRVVPKENEGLIFPDLLVITIIVFTIFMIVNINCHCHCLFKQVPSISYFCFAINNIFNITEFLILSRVRLTLNRVLDWRLDLLTTGRSYK
jgi:hypothetical protein